MTPDSQLKARIMLERVARTVGAVLVSGPANPIYRLTVRETNGQETTFVIDSGYIRTPMRMTCYQVNYPMPPDEKIAVALLKLKNKPAQFYELAETPGHWVDWK